MGFFILKLARRYQKLVGRKDRNHLLNLGKQSKPGEIHPSFVNINNILTEF